MQGMHWKGEVHGILNFPLSCPETTPIQVDAPIIHFGYVSEIMQSRDKLRRNMELAENRCRSQPNHPWVWGLLVREQMNAGDFNSAARSADIAWKLAEVIDDYKGQETPLVELAARRTFLLLQNGNLTEALDCADKAIAWGGFHPNTGILRAQILYRLYARSPGSPAAGDYLARALSDANQCIDFGDRMTAAPVLGGSSSWNALYWRAVIELLQSRPERALSDFRASLQGNPRHRMAQIGCADALIVMGKTAEALKILEPMLPMMIPDSWVLAAAAYHGLGMTDRAVHCIKAVSSAGIDVFGLQHRAVMLDQLRSSHKI